MYIIWSIYKGYVYVSSVIITERLTVPPSLTHSHHRRVCVCACVCVCVCVCVHVCVYWCELETPCTVEQSVRLLLFFFWLRFFGFVWVRIPLMLMSTLWSKLLFLLSCLETERFSFFRFFFFYINMYIYIYLEFRFCFSSSFRDWSLQHFQV